METDDFDKLPEEQQKALIIQWKAREREKKARILQGKKTLADMEDEMVNEMYAEAMPISNVIVAFKRKWLQRSEPLKAMKMELSKAAPDQESYTYNSKDGRKKAIIRHNFTDRYDDGIKAGIEFAKKWLNAQVLDDKSEQLISIIDDLLAKGNTGSYSPANLMKFIKKADEIDDDLLKKAAECIRDSIYEEPTSVSILMKEKDENGIERTIPLSATKA